MAPPVRPQAGNQRQIQLQRQISTDEVMEETPDIVTFFIADRMEAQGNRVPEGMRVTSVNKEIGSCLKQVADELEKNHRFNYLFSRIIVTPQTAFATFADVAKEIFSDGVFNWARVVALLYFGFKLASSVVTQVDLLKRVIDWVVRFVKERLVNWIAQQGGWTAIKEYVVAGMAHAREASVVQLIGVALAGVAVVLMVLGRN